MELQKISRLLNDSTVLEFLPRQCIRMNDFSNCPYFIKEYKI